LDNPIFRDDEIARRSSRMVMSIRSAKSARVGPKPAVRLKRRRITLRRFRVGNMSNNPYDNMPDCRILAG
jgi:hypothetical protein